MKKIILLLVFFGCMFLTACKTKVQVIEQEKTFQPIRQTNPVKIPTNGTTFFFLRHAETENINSKNPHLSSYGIKRAYKYAMFFKNKRVDTVFTTNLNRTVETAKIIADSKSVPLVYYNPFEIDYNQFYKNHLNSTSVIVGHSNTSPAFANGIIGKIKYVQMEENNYADFFEVVINGNNDIFDAQLNINNEIQKMEDSKLSPKELRKVLRERKNKSSK